MKQHKLTQNMSNSFCIYFLKAVYGPCVMTLQGTFSHNKHSTQTGYMVYQFMLVASKVTKPLQIAVEFL